MGEQSIQNLLEESFSKSNRQEWKRAATTELNGSEPFTHLRWKDADNLDFLPYYDKQDASSLQYLRLFDFFPKKNSFLGNRSWSNLPREIVTEDLAANRNAVEHLHNGADGVLFTLYDKSAAVNVLLKDIQPQYCVLSFDGDIGENFLRAFEAYLGNANNTPVINGQIFWDQLPSDTDNFKFLFRYPDYKPLGVTIAASTPVQEIHHALVAGVQAVERFSHEMKTKEIIDHICFSVPLHTNVLLDIAKLKVLRMLWFQVAYAFGYSTFSPEQLHIHARSEQWTAQQYEPHGNMLRSTTAAMAAIIGGCDSLTVNPQDPGNPMQNRIARNVSNILREESHFDKVADPLAGAYVVDVMVDTIAKHVWSLFQSTVRR